MRRWAIEKVDDDKWFVTSALTEADARLIAAAPELLEALETIEDLTMMPWDNTVPNDAYGFEDFRDIARAAIAKAKGEQ